MTTTVFLDTETTGLDPARHEPWEVALIVRGHHRPEWDGEWVLQIAVDLANADATALNIGRFWQRRHMGLGAPGETVLTAWPVAAGVRTGLDVALADRPDSLHQHMDRRGLATLLGRLLAGAVVVGSNPAFDLAMLTALLAKAFVPAPWHYRPVDVVTLAAGYLRAAGGYDELTADPAYRSELLAAECHVHLPDAAERHTALGDARWAQRWYDALAGHLGLAGLIVDESPAAGAELVPVPHVWAVGDVVRHRANVKPRRTGEPWDGWVVMEPLNGLARQGTLVDHDGDLRLRRPTWDDDYTHARATDLVLETPAPVTPAGGTS